MARQIRYNCLECNKEWVALENSSTELLQICAQCYTEKTISDSIDGETDQATHAELCDQALEHYESLAKECCHWNSLIPKAIEFYKEYGTSLPAPCGDNCMWEYRGARSCTYTGKGCGCKFFKYYCNAGENNE